MGRKFLGIVTVLSFLVFILSVIECWYILTPAAAKQLNPTQLGNAFFVWTGSACVTLVATWIGAWGLVRTRRDRP